MAPPRADFREVYAAGVKIANWQIAEQIVAGKAALAQWGTYGYQRDKATNTWFYEYADASNYAVGVFMAGAGYGEWESVTIAQAWGFFTSSTKYDKTARYWTERGLTKECGDKNVEVRQVGDHFHWFGSRRRNWWLDWPSLLPVLRRVR